MQQNDSDEPAGHWSQDGDGWQGGYHGSGFGGQDDAPGWALPAPPPRRPRRGGRALVYIAVAGLAAGIGAGITVAVDRDDGGPAAGISARQGSAPHGKAAGAGAVAGLNQAAVQGRVDPGLVDITATLRLNDETAEGTGMIVSRSGLVLTNNHVIDGATGVRVALADSGAPRDYPARVVGYDSSGDIALLQLQGASGLTAVRFGDSSRVRLGTPVLALGNAQGRGGVTSAAGVINALDRSIKASDEGSGTTEDLRGMLQTDAEIQQGDSGGALADNAGKVIGMITAANGGGPGQLGGTLGFAIPSDTALRIVGQIEAGRASSTVYIGLPGFLGVDVAQSDSPDPRQQAADERQSGNGNGSFAGGRNGGACLTDGQQPAVPASIAPAGTGALIIGVLCGTAASSRGLAPGDVITSVNGQAVTTPGSLTAITARHHPGDVVTIAWEGTDGTRHAASITLGDGPAR
ncbi:MAG: trypsin-like peptidase domain-containing protein [Streptosporangiaceae bacterium]|nr:trypsin-like peptidase domain-containing protein [Streptosporangiaceae bacterium]